MLDGSNNGVHPTASQQVSHRELAWFRVGCAAGDAGRWVAEFKEHAKRIVDTRKLRVMYRMAARVRREPNKRLQPTPR